MREKYDTAFAGGFDSRLPGPGGPRSGTRGGSASGGGRAPDNTRQRRGFRASPLEAVSRQRELNKFLMSYFSTPQVWAYAPW